MRLARLTYIVVCLPDYPTMTWTHVGGTAVAQLDGDYSAFAIDGST
jgi:hypothetical protein